jgi:CHASE2 domain-containing sensor protein
MVVSENGARFPADLFRGKIVFVGLGLRSSTGPSQRDAFLTPFDAATFGTELHATIASNLLAQEWLQQPARWVVMLLQLGVAASVGWLLFSLSGPPALLVFSAALALFGVCELGLFYAGWFVPCATGLVWGIFSGLLIRVIVAQSSTRRARRRA